MTYSEKLRNPLWQRKRLEIFQRDNFKCVSCGSGDKSIQVHHLVYRKIDPWAYPDYLYQTLCEDCHATRGELTDKIVDAVRISLKDIPTASLFVSAQKLCAEAMIEIGLTNGVQQPGKDGARVVSD